MILVELSNIKEYKALKLGKIAVTPFAGVWIEM